MAFKMGHIGYWKGKSLSDEHKRKISLTLKGRKLKNAGTFIMGHKPSLETRKKISQSLKGRTFSEEHKQNLSEALKGRTLSKATRQKMSQSRKGENHPMFGRRRELAPNWRGGISFQSYGEEFNNSLKLHIRTRDNFICQFCLKSEKELEALLDIHHIDYCKTNNNPTNLISLCRKCHGKTNYNREYWMQKLKDKLEVMISE